MKNNGCILGSLLLLMLFLAASRANAQDGPMGVERIARAVSAGYESRPAARDDEVRWVQIDLGASHPIDAVKLFPLIDWGPNAVHYPVRFRIEASDDPGFTAPAAIVDCTRSDVPPPGDVVAVYPASGVSGRYIRLTVTRTRDRQFALARLVVWSAGKEIAVGCPASDSATGNLGRIALTRPPRPQGDGVVTDNPKNVIPSPQWRPVPDRIETPKSGVRLEGGLFQKAMENNVAYLLNSFSLDEMLRPFRERAGKPIPAGLRKPDPFWDVSLPGSSAGRFLMGAGNTLRWMAHPELRSRLDRIVDGIEECRQPDGFIMAYPENTIFFSERAAYTRSWVTHGLIEAGYAGNTKAFGLLRSHYDWFDHCAYLPELLRRAGQGVQGMVASTRTYFTPIGKPEDLQTVQRYFQENYWLDELAARDPRAIWQYPYDHPHCYLITSLEPYLDLYRATGAKRYLQAALGGWELYHDRWEHVGGSIAICEGDSYPPGSYYLRRHTGELCGSVFWVRYNQRFHHLYPEQERYVNEIEKSIYNVGLANQVDTRGIRYHANLVGRKDGSTPIAVNSCCEGQGTRLLGSLPEYLYSLAKDGLYVDLYAPSRITWTRNGASLTAQTQTAFPFKPDVRIKLTAARATRAKIRLRVPAWAARPMTVRLNDAVVAAGKPGAYVVLDRLWGSGDTIAFTLPVSFRLTPYSGLDVSPGPRRYALEYGPVLMALVGAVDEQKGAQLAIDPATLAKRLRPIAGRPLHFAIDGDPRCEYMPYWEVTDQVFTCYPAIGTSAAPAVETVHPQDLALASRGATATADSEYAREPACTSKVIDGVIATPDDFSNRWHSSLDTPHPHWVEIKLPKPALIGAVIVHFADPGGHPTSFEGTARVGDRTKTLFDVRDYGDGRVYRANIAPVITDTFRLTIRESVNQGYPNAAQVSEIELLPPGVK